ncbi:MAG: site-specific DNA-methyltransferase [Chloroflexi bacterium]|nr:MAG: site-specific DNA-methyltransferase [Chloroflexota bacterium]
MEQKRFIFQAFTHPKDILKDVSPVYTTDYGAAYLDDALTVLRRLKEKKTSVNLVITSPPYALHFQKQYDEASRSDYQKWSKSDYIPWFLSFAREIYELLPDDGSFVLNIGGSYNKGEPTRSLYHYKLLIALVEEIGFHLAQECFWYNPAKMPMPAEWVTVRRIRVRDSVEFVWWLSKTPWPKADNRQVLRKYSNDMNRLNAKGLNTTTRPGGYVIKPSWSKVDAGGAIPPNVLEDIPEDILKFGNNSANDKYTLKCKEAGIKPHPARFPAVLPEFFIKLLTNEYDLILDPFSGSNTTGAVAERLNRRWIAVEKSEEYIMASQFRFEE